MMTSLKNKNSNELTKSWYYDCFQGATIFEPYAKEIANRLECSEEVKIVLEIASGTGRATAHIRRSMPAEAVLVASDIDQEMLAIAQQKLEHEKIDWQTIDAHKLPFKNDSIDIVVCCFGLMFTDLDLALGEAYRVLRPGGKLIFTTWDSLDFNPVQRIFRDVVSDFFQERLDEKHSKPFLLNDDSFIRSKLSLPGFRNITIVHVKKNISEAEISVLITGLINGSLLSQEIARRCPEKTSDIEHAVKERVEMELNSQPFEAPVQALICSAFK